MVLLKNKLLCLAALLASFVFSVPAFAGTLITSPIDGRPVSNEYLGKLARLNGDDFYTADKKYLDMFTADGSEAHFADSAKVRQNLKSLIAKHNSEDTTVIINASTYFTGGLIGSRCAENYGDTDKAVKELFETAQLYKKPKYYVNVAMPRNLPDSRGKAIWCDDKKIDGLAHFYLKYNEDKDAEKYDSVTPEQFLMEYGYVYNKAQEIGEDKISTWEKDFLAFADKNYVKSPVYGKYIESYKIPFEKTAEICEALVRWQRVGIIDELVIGNDDLQLPQSVSWFYSKNAHWIQTENGSPVKFSFSRTEMTTGKNSVRNRLIKTYGKDETALALKGESQKVNFIFGMDEIPQLIYARSIAQRKGEAADINIIKNKTGEAAEYDVLTADKLTEYALAFLKGGQKVSDKKVNMFVYDYSAEDTTADFEKNIEKSLDSGEKTGLIELYTSDTLNGKNEIFKKLVSDKKITYLTSFSAWNTNANAIGLGLAHAQTAALTNAEGKVFAQKNAQILAQHIIEDGLYFANVRQKLTAEGYVPSKQDGTDSTYLRSLLKTDDILWLFKSKGTAGEKTDKITLKKVCFPWRRLFDCQIDAVCEE